MANSYEILYQGAPAAGTTTTLLTVGGSAQVIVSNIKIVNTHASNSQTVKLMVGGTADSNVILATTTVAAGNTGEWNGALTLEANQTIRATIGATDQIITITIAGNEVT